LCLLGRLIQVKVSENWLRWSLSHYFFDFLRSNLSFSILSELWSHGRFYASWMTAEISPGLVSGASGWPGAGISLGLVTWLGGGLRPRLWGNDSFDWRI
jgi:hypothetical protein